MTRASSRFGGLSPVANSLQTAANRMAAAIRPPDRGAAMFSPSGRAAAVSNAFGQTLRRRRKSRALKRKARKAAKIVRRRATRRRANRHAKFVKGSAAAKRHMAALRKLRKRRRA